MLCGVKFFFCDVWNSVGDANGGCFSTFCMEELVGETVFKYLEYGTSLFNVVDLARVQYPYLKIWRDL